MPERIKCDECFGTGVDEDDFVCPVCDGSGYLDVDHDDDDEDDDVPPW